MSAYKTTKGKVAGIETMGLVDGPGVRTVVFLQGCPLRCKYCHNPEMHENCSKIAKKCTPKQLIQKIKRFKPYFKDGGGVTFSGGEPLVQSGFLLECLKLCREEEICTAIDTSGIGDNYDEVLDTVDLVILDIKACNEKEFKELTGGDFKKFKQFLKTCQQKKKHLWLRQVIVPNLNDDEKHINELADFVKNIKRVDRIELLPFHKMAQKKYDMLNISYPFALFPEMDKEKCKKIENKLKKIIKK